MTEQQADALMCYMEAMAEYGLVEELAALTALCRHRDRVVYESVARKLWGTDEHDVLPYVYEMQTWGEV